jgi:hypothetical protein
MGLNLKALAAPFTNRVHLVTIVLSGMLFGAFRLSGGEFTIKTRDSIGERSSTSAPSARATSGRRPTAAEERGSQLDGLLAKSPRIEYGNGEPANRVPTTVRPPSRLTDQSSNIDELVDVGRESAPRPAAPRSRDNGSGLNDIEKQLGLR